MPPKPSLFIILSIITCFFMHACNPRLLGDLMTTSDSHNKFPQDKIEEKVRVGMNSTANSRVTTDDRRTLISSKPELEEETLCKKSKDNIKGANSGSEDCKSSLNEAVIANATKPEGSRWPSLNAKKVLHPSMLSEEDLIETDYQPPRRKSPIHN